jgi:hypothetical protein
MRIGVVTLFPEMIEAARSGHGRCGGAGLWRWVWNRGIS